MKKAMATISKNFQRFWKNMTKYSEEDSKYEKIEKSTENSSVSSNFECNFKKSRKKRKKKQKSNRSKYVRSEDCQSESDASCSSSEIQMKKSKKSHQRCKKEKYVITETQHLKIVKEAKALQTCDCCIKNKIFKREQEFLQFHTSTQVSEDLKECLQKLKTKNCLVNCKNPKRRLPDADGIFRYDITDLKRLYEKYTHLYTSPLEPTGTPISDEEYFRVYIQGNGLWNNKPGKGPPNKSLVKDEYSKIDTEVALEKEQHEKVHVRCKLYQDFKKQNIYPVINC